MRTEHSENAAKQPGKQYGKPPPTSGVNTVSSPDADCRASGKHTSKASKCPSLLFLRDLGLCLHDV